jgi:hypothetical protein
VSCFGIALFDADRSITQPSGGGGEPPLLAFVRAMLARFADLGMAVAPSADELWRAGVPVWHERGPGWDDVRATLHQAVGRAEAHARGARCQFLLCVLGCYPSAFYKAVKTAGDTARGVGVVSQVVLTRAAGVGAFCVCVFMWLSRAGWPDFFWRLTLLIALACASCAFTLLLALSAKDNTHTHAHTRAKHLPPAP